MNKKKIGIGILIGIVAIISYLFYINTLVKPPKGKPIADLKTSSLSVSKTSSLFKGKSDLAKVVFVYESNSTESSGLTRL